MGSSHDCAMYCRVADTGGDEMPFACLRIQNGAYGNLYPVFREDIHWLAGESGLAVCKAEWLVNYVQPRMESADEDCLPQCNGLMPLLLDTALAAGRLDRETMLGAYHCIALVVGGCRMFTPWQLAPDGWAYEKILLPAALDNVAPVPVKKGPPLRSGKAYKAQRRLCNANVAEIKKCLHTMLDAMKCARLVQ